MKSVDRMKAVLHGENPDRWPFVPSVYEHGAALIGKDPGGVSRDRELMAEAALESYRRYDHDIVTVGIDIYNVEAEALGCDISSGGQRSIPGVVSHPLKDAEMDEMESLEVPKPAADNRLGLLVGASSDVEDAIGDEVWVYGCSGGAFSQAVELRGFEQFIEDIYVNPEKAEKLMEVATQLSLEQAERLARNGCGIYLFESWATIPLIRPTIFRDYVVPANRKVISHVRENFDVPPPAVIMGGDTAQLMDFFIEAGTSLVVADFNTDFDFMRQKMGDRDMVVRGCVDPKLLETGEWDKLEESITTLSKKAEGMNRFVWGCGCVPYDAPAENVLRFKEMCLAADRS